MSDWERIMIPFVDGGVTVNMSRVKRINMWAKELHPWSVLNEWKIWRVSWLDNLTVMVLWVRLKKETRLPRVFLQQKRTELARWEISTAWFSLIYFPLDLFVLKYTLLDVIVSGVSSFLSCSLVPFLLILHLFLPHFLFLSLCLFIFSRLSSSWVHC